MFQQQWRKEWNFSMFYPVPETPRPHLNHSREIGKFQYRFLLFLYLCCPLAFPAEKRSIIMISTMTVFDGCV